MYLVPAEPLRFKYFVLNVNVCSIISKLEILAATFNLSWTISISIPRKSAIYYERTPPQITVHFFQKKVQFQPIIEKGSTTHRN